MAEIPTTDYNAENHGDVLFSINKLACAYSNNSPVLEAKNVVIPREKITVLLGASGAGKSTLLETLGLMTQTINETSSEILFYPVKGEEYDLAQMWGADKESERYNIRMLYYSFIFQSTNLMPNFSALENVGLTELIQNKPESVAYFNAIETLVKELSVTSLSYTKKPFEFSGGERQRLAFARAVNPEFTVLFGDEPTGNLDHFNSQKLMHFIREYITVKKKNTSAIIVSHNIPLSLDFADQIIVITKKSNGVSTIDPFFVYRRDELKWHEDPAKQAQIQNEIELLLNSDTESYGRILMTLSENEVSEEFFNDIKDRMVAWHAEVHGSVQKTLEEKEEFQKKLTNIIEEKVPKNCHVEEYIKQFASGQVKKADIKINEVIRTIQDLKIKTAVEGEREKKHKSSNNIENVELKGNRSPLGMILGFAPWLILSIAPFISFLISNIVNGIATVFGRKKAKKAKQQVDDELPLSGLLFAFKEFIPSVFYNTCVAWDWINIRFKLFAKRIFGKGKIIHNPIPHDFKHLFFRNETRVILGNNNKNFWLVVVILTFTFLAIGFSNGSLSYLKNKMEDPFVRTVDAKIPGTYSEKRAATEAIALYNESDSLKSLYHYDSIVGFNSRLIYFRGNLEESVIKGLTGRSIPFDDPLVATILDPKINSTIGSPFLDERDYSIIVTRDLITKLGCSEKPAFLYKKRGDGRLIPIPIRAIVDRLPGEKMDFLMTQYCYDNYNRLSDRFLYKDNKMLYLQANIDSVKGEELKTACNEFFKRYKIESGDLQINNVDMYRQPYCYQDLFIIQISFFDSDYIETEMVDSLYSKLRNSTEIQAFVKKESLQPNQIVQSYYPNLDEKKSSNFDLIAINFKDLSMIDDFASKFTDDSGIKLELSKIEQMKNYNFVSKITQIMSVILIIFSVLMINIFLSNILSTHLNNIKMNIGTFKAFGIDIKRIYIGMMYNFVLLPLTLSLLIAATIGYLGGIYHAIKLISPFPIEKNLYFDLNNLYTLISIMVLTTVNYYVFSIIVNRIFRKTPGDLIYDRSNKA